MRRCLAAGETPVGALVLRGDAVLGEGHEETRTLLDPVERPRGTPFSPTPS
jgi:tRNA(Arg) A34 adenosine deaminase TadA